MDPRVGHELPVAITIWFWERAVRLPLNDNSVIVLVSASPVIGSHLVSWMPKPPNVMHLFTGADGDDLPAANTAAASDMMPEDVTPEVLSATIDGITYTVRGSLDMASFPAAVGVTEVQPAIVPAGWPEASSAL